LALPPIVGALLFLLDLLVLFAADVAADVREEAGMEATAIGALETVSEACVGEHEVRATN
jgi:hypothetical protein